MDSSKSEKLSKRMAFLAKHARPKAEIDHGDSRRSGYLSEETHQIVRQHLGRIENDHVLRGISSLMCTRFSTAERVHEKSEYRPYAGGRFYRATSSAQPDLKEVIACAKIVEKVIFCSKKTYEGRPVSMGVCIAEHPDTIVDSSSYVGGKSPNWIIRFTQEVNVIEMENDAFFELSQLSDGKRLFLVCGTTGYAVGVVSTVESGEGLRPPFGDFDVITTLSGKCILYGNGDMPFVYDGFNWRSWWNYDIVDRIRSFFHFKRIEQLKNMPVPNLIFADILDERKWELLGSTARLFSEVGRSSIFCVCNQRDIDDLIEKGAISSMRPVLDNVDLSAIYQNQALMNRLLELDGAHFFSPDLKLVRACQRISVQPVKGVQLSGSGSGSNAAMHLSKLVGKGGIVVKVSSDGPVKIYSNGKHLNSRTELTDATSPFELADIFENEESWAIIDRQIEEDDG